MQMIDVLKRLAELDAQNPNVDKSGLPQVKEDQGIVVKEDAVQECGMMGGMMPPPPPSFPPTPARINIEAGSGEEIADMLSTLMQLSGMKHDHGDHNDHDTAHDDEEVVTGEPSMRSMIDKLNPDLQMDEYAYEPASPTDVPDMNNDAMINTGMHNQDPAGHGGVGDRKDGDQPRAFARESTYESLMSDYRKFLEEKSN